MALAEQEWLEGPNGLLLRSVNGDPVLALNVRPVVRAHSDELKQTLPGVVGDYSGRVSAIRHHQRIAKSKTGEAYVISTPETGIIGQATLLLKTLGRHGIEAGIGYDERSAMIDYWIVGDNYDKEVVGREAGRLLIDRGYDVTDDVPPHSWLYDNDSIEPSCGLRRLMTSYGRPTLDYLGDDADKNASKALPARLHVAKPQRHLKVA